MIFRALADGVLILHLAFLLFVVLGGLLVLRRPGVAWIHLPLAAWGVLVEYAGIVCPLTPLENYLRQRGGEGGYAGGFIDHYITAVLYPPGLTRSMQIVLGSAALALNLAVYWRVIRAARAERAPGA
jgi:hypothetical protein